MSDFGFAIRETLEAEGVFSDHNYDPGGPTKFGITEHLARLYGYEGDMEELPRSFAVRVYELHFWGWLRLYDVDSKFLAAEIFDTGVNLGRRWGAWIAQLSTRTLGTLRRDAMRFFSERDREAVERFERLPLRDAVDGVIGPVTLGAINALARPYEAELYQAMNGWQWLRYLGLTDDQCRAILADFERQSWRDEFVRGWAKRLVRFPEMLPTGRVA